jgi:hypothetical protein
MKRPARSGVKLPRWDKEEEARLRAAVAEFGESWQQCADKISTEGHER